MKTKANALILRYCKKLILIFTIFAISSVTFAQNISPYTNFYSLEDPNDVSFAIEWGESTTITNVVFFYWDEFDEYQETTLSSPADYQVSGNELTITQTFLNGLSPENGWELRFYAQFNSGPDAFFDIRVVQTLIPYVFEDSKEYDLSNPDDVFATIGWALGEDVTEVSVGGTPLSLADYEVQGDFLIFNNTYLATVLTGVGNSITATVTFDTDDSDTFVIEAVQSGIVAPEFSQSQFDINMSEMPEYIETIITWNGASSITGMTVTMAENTGFPESMPYEDYTVTPIDGQTATLRIYLGGGKATKEMEYFYVTIAVTFNVGTPQYIFLGLFYEYFIVDITPTPDYAGYVSGGGEYEEGEEVIIEAFYNPNYSFVKWIIDGSVEEFQNPYTFTMPGNNVNIVAEFQSDYPEVTSSFPANNQFGIDPESFIQITFDRNIIEGTTNNGFDDITFETGGMPFGITDIYIFEGNKLVIEPNSPMNMNTSYFLTIPPEAIEDANAPGTYMAQHYFLEFTTGMGDFTPGEISPEMNIFSVMEPGNVDFYIDWGDESSIEHIYYYYYDELDVYHETELTLTTDYLVDGNILTINQSFIEGLSLEPGDSHWFYANFNSGFNSHFGIYIIETTIPTISPDALSYDLNNPDDVFTNILFNMAESVSSVEVNSVALVENTDYHIEGIWLFIHNSYLQTELTAVDDFVEIDVEFNTSDVSTLTITAIQSGITNATINPESGTFELSEMPETLETVITWNSASSVESLTIYSLEDGVMMEYDYPYYTVTPIDANTATLSIDLTQAGKGLTNTKTIDTYYATIKIEFDLGAEAFYYLTMTEEYYEVFVDVNPAFTGWVEGSGEFYIDEEVELEAFATPGYVFQNWRIDGTVVSDQNPYIFTMPDYDINITAYFIPETAPTYTLSLVADPIAGGTVSGGGDFILGESVTVTAIPETGYAFINWTDELDNIVSTSAEYTFTMPESNLTLTATFSDASVVNPSTLNNVELYPNPFSDFIYFENYNAIEKVSIISVTGQIVMIFDNIQNNMINTSNLNNGFYFISIESHDGETIVKKMLKQ